MEEWADESIGKKSRTVLFEGISNDQRFRSALLPSGTPDFVKTLIESVPGDVLKTVGIGLGATPDAVRMAQQEINQNLEALCLILQQQPYLVGDQPTLADFAVAGLSLLLKFPEGPYLDLPEQLRGKGVPGIADSYLYEPFFTWRDRLYAQYRKPLVPSSGSSSDSRPTSIQIE